MKLRKSAHSGMLMLRHWLGLAGFRAFCLIFCLMGAGSLQAQTYSNKSEPWVAIDTSTHTKINYNSSPIKFYKPSGSNCGTSGTVIDDTITDPINIGFTFNYGGVDFTQLRVMTNGRVQFGTNSTCGSGTDNAGATIYAYDYPDALMNYTMRIYGADLDPTAKVVDGVTVNGSYPTSCASNAQCYVSYATTGTAPNRRFIVSWTNVPKWISAGQIAGSFSMNIILEENSEFVFQYNELNDVPGVPAQIGWQVQAPYDYDIKQTALPDKETAIRYYIGRPVAQYQMEQASWSTAAGQIIDTSGNGRHGARIGGVNTVSTGYACRGAAIPSNSNSGVIDAIDTGINIPSVLGSAGAISFWYKPTVWAGANASSVSGQLLDASVDNTGWFFLSKIWVSSTTTKLVFMVRDSTGVDRVVETPAMPASALNSSGWIHIGVSWNFNALPAANSDHLRVYVNGAGIGTGYSRESAFSSSGTVSSTIGSLYLGDNRSSFVSSSGVGASANGTLDEVRIYSFEGGLGLILGNLNEPPVCASHYLVSNPTSGQTCRDTNVTVVSHDASHNNIKSGVTINLSTSTGRGDWTLVSGYGVLNNGTADDGSATYQFNNEYQAVFALTHTTTGTVRVAVSDGQLAGGAVSGEAQDLVLTTCNGTARFNGCELSATRCNAAVSGYDRLMTKLASRSFNLDAVALTSTGALDTTFASPITVDLMANLAITTVAGSTSCPATSAAVIPLGSVTFAAGRPPSAGIPVPNSAFTAVDPKYSAYQDVRMRFTCSSVNCPPSGITNCSKDNFAVRPTDLVVTAPVMTNSSATTGSPKLVAGASFDLNVQARDDLGANAKGYNSTPFIDASLASQFVTTHLGLTSYSDRLQNFSGGSLPGFGTASSSTGSASGAFYYPSYGQFRIMAGGAQDTSFVTPTVDPPGTDCVANSSSNTADSAGRFGCNIASKTNSSLIGRFYPSSFVLNSGSIVPACPSGGFSYLGQPFAVNVAVSAMSAAGALSSMVMPLYAAVTPTFAAENANNGTNLSSRLSVTSGSWINGVYTLTASATTFSRLAAADGPYDALDIGIQIVDPDGAVLSARDMKPDSSGSCTASTCTFQKISATATKTRYGRLRMLNAYGSELLPLPMSLTTQYWNGSAYALHTLDSCTTLPVPSLGSGMVFGAGNLTAGETIASIQGVTSGSGTLVAGDAGFSLTKPGAGNNGNVDITVTAPIWLQFPWQGGSNISPTARATFGLFRSPLIYRRENY